MTIKQGNCPSCGGEVHFKIGSSFIVVCQYCNSLVARNDQKLEDLGKVAEVIETESLIKIGFLGRYKGVGFQVTGRTQLKHQMGGFWTEWYAAFDDGRWGWISEAQGKLYILFAEAVSELPNYFSLNVGQVADLKLPVKFTVAEKGIATYSAAQGEIPFRFTPGERYNYVDLAGNSGEFATLDYGEQSPLIFLGQEIRPIDLGIETFETIPDQEAAKKVSTTNIPCPNCAGPLELKAPEKTERVACPYCGSLLDLNQGKLKFLEAFHGTKSVPLISLGSKAIFDGIEATVIGFMVRSTVDAGVKYCWDEYLLYNSEKGFNWLVCSDHHWTFVKPVNVGQVRERAKQADYQGRSYKLFQDGPAKVEYVLGEFYWKVSVGEESKTADYVSSSEMLSKELSLNSSGAISEVVWSLGSYLTTTEIKEKFKLQNIKEPTTVGPCQPFPYIWIYKYWAIFAALVFATGLFLFITTRPYTVIQKSFSLTPVATNEATQVFFTESFDLEARRNIVVTANSPVNNSWLYFEGDFVNEETGLVQSFDMAMEYYHGVDGGEAWSEGSQQNRTYISSLPAGKYTMRIEAQWQNWQQPSSLQVTVEQGRARFVHFIVAFLAVSLLPVGLLFYHLQFNQQKWGNSNYSPYNSSDE